MKEGTTLALSAVVAASMIGLARSRTRPLASIASDAFYDGLLPRALPTFSLPVLKSTERGLVIGMGGGCDVLGALAVAQAWQQVSEPGATIIFGNCPTTPICWLTCWRTWAVLLKVTGSLAQCLPNAVPCTAKMDRRSFGHWAKLNLQMGSGHRPQAAPLDRRKYVPRWSAPQTLC